MRTVALRLLTSAALSIPLWSQCTMAKTCSVAGASLAFGIYAPMSGANLDVIGTVTVECTGSIYAVLSISIGNGAGASYDSGRRMSRNGVGSLRYNIYADASRTQVLGDGTGGSVTLNINGNRSLSQPIWARIPALQTSVVPGSYADVLITTITY